MIFDPILDIFRGKAVTIPPMDGALKPNTLLDDAAVLVEATAPDNLLQHGGTLFFSSGAGLWSIGGSGVARVIEEFEAPITALAAVDGCIAVALDDGSIVIGGDERPDVNLTAANFDGAACPTAMDFLDAETLIVCQGSTGHRHSDWALDLMEKKTSGSIWRVDLGTGQAQLLARDLAFPHGLLIDRDNNRLIVAESWRHRLVTVPLKGAVTTPTPLLAKLPGYPARLCSASDGGAWLALFAPRNRLVEFVLLEDSYRADMVRDVPRPYWIAPALSSGTSFLEPLQCGGVKTMGVHKPWSPSLSYGLVVHLDRQLRPTHSLHSRANGKRHGVTSLIELDGQLLAASKGGNAILDISIDDLLGEVA